MKNANDYLGLFDWWNNELTQEEKLILNQSYKPMGASNDGLEAEKIFQYFNKGGYGSSSASPVNYLTGMADYISAKQHFKLKIKLLQKAESISKIFSYTCKHFLYLSFINLYNGLNGSEFENKELYHLYCKKTVAIADMVREEIMKEGWNTLPAHIGYEGVFEELKAQAKYEEAIKLIIDGREKGWNIQYLISDVWELIEEQELNPMHFGLKKESEYYSQAEIDNNPYLRISLLMGKIESKIEMEKPFDKEANEVLESIEKNNLKNYITLESLYKIGSAFYKKGEKERGINIFTRIKTSVEGLSPVSISNFYAEIGKLLYSKNDIDLAYDWLKNGLEINQKLAVKSLIKKIEKSKMKD